MNRDRKFIATAFEVARIWSKDPSTKVGAIAVGAQPNQVTFGWNGFPPGMEDRPEWLNDRSEKYKRVVHAEVNALINASGFEPRCLYVTHPPCTACSLLIMAHRTVRRVVWARPPLVFRQRWEADLEAAEANLRGAGIECVEVAG